MGGATRRERTAVPGFSAIDLSRLEFPQRTVAEALVLFAAVLKALSKGGAIHLKRISVPGSFVTCALRLVSPPLKAVDECHLRH